MQRERKREREEFPVMDAHQSPTLRGTAKQAAK